MATKFRAEQVTQRFNRTASEAVTGNRLAKLNASDHEKVDMCDTANDDAVGIIEFDGEAGVETVLKCGGHLELEAGGTIAVGDEIVSDNVGRGVARGSTATTRYNIVGKALTQAALGETFMIDWSRYTTFGANAS